LIARLWYNESFVEHRIISLYSPLFASAINRNELVPVAESLLAGDNAANNVGIERQGLFVRVSESFFSVYGRPVTLFLQIKT